MGEPARRAMTADEFLHWDDGTDIRYELVNGEIVAMAPPTDAHGSITGNAWGEIDARLRERSPCRGIVEAGIRIDASNHFKADVAATCAETRGELYVEEPFLIVEVLSEGSWRDDIGAKPQRYIQLPSIREIWLIDSRERWVEIWRRAEDTWIVTMPLRGSASSASAALEDDVQLDALYRNTGL
jgi:Uma2 family endonuclease